MLIRLLQSFYCFVPPRLVWFVTGFLFLLQVLDVIAPPYTSDFVQLFLPILENDSIAGTIKTEGECDAVAEFIGKIFTAVWLYFLYTLNYVPDSCFSTCHGTCSSLYLFRVACPKPCTHIFVTRGYVK